MPSCMLREAASTRSIISFISVLSGMQSGTSGGSCLTATLVPAVPGKTELNSVCI